MTKPLLARWKPFAARPRRLAARRRPLAARRKPLAALLITAALLAAAPSAAQAGTYAVVGCADLAGATTPSHVTRPADGWFLEQGVYPSRQDCAAGRDGLGIYATG